jgi:hypothetical protein
VPGVAALKAPIDCFAGWGRAAPPTAAYDDPSVKMISPELRAYAKNTDKSQALDLDALTAEYERTLTGPAIENAKRYKAIAKDDLLKLPTLKALYDASGKWTEKGRNKVYDDKYAERQAEMLRKDITLNAGWSNPKSADVKYREFETKSRKVTPKETDLGDAVAEPQYEKIKQAWKRMQVFVEPQILQPIQPPKVRILKSNGSFRAYYKDNVVFVDEKEDIPTIVHETGHHLEETVQETVWAAFHGLLYARQEEATAKGKDKLKSLGMDADEIHYPIDMPATGSYTVKYYKQGGAELMSMGPQFLSEPKTTKKLIDKDPQYAAVLAQQFLPQEFVAAGLDRFGQPEPEPEPEPEPLPTSRARAYAVGESSRPVPPLPEAL